MTFLNVSYNVYTDTQRSKYIWSLVIQASNPIFQNAFSAFSPWIQIFHIRLNTMWILMPGLKEV